MAAALLCCAPLGLTGCAVADPSSATQVGNEVQAFFTDPLSPSTDNELAAALMRFLADAQDSLDVAIYHLDDPRILEALGHLCTRGVRLRMVLDREAMQSDSRSLTERVPCAQVHVSAGSGLMHHKFAVADGRAVWTGSANWTMGGLAQQANNALWVESADLAQQYTRAFERLIDANSASRTRTHEPGAIALAERIVHVFFSPDTQIENELIRWIQTAKHSIQLAMYYYTNDRLHKALLDALTRGVRVDALWDRQGWQGCDYSEMDEMLSLGVGQIAPLPGLLHHKFAVLDGQVVFAGSANWTGSAFAQNAENVLIIEDAPLAARYQAEFNRLAQDAFEYAKSSETPWRMRVEHFNTTSGTARLEWHPKPQVTIDGFEVCRAASATAACERTFEEIPAQAWYFVDADVQPGRTYFYRLRASIGGQWQPFGPATSIFVGASTWPALSAAQAEERLGSLSGQTVTVAFLAADVFVSQEGNAFLSAERERTEDFTAFIPACALERFQALGVDPRAYQGHSLRVSGELIRYRGPEIVVYDPGQIQVENP